MLVVDVFWVMLWNVLILWLMGRFYMMDLVIRVELFSVMVESVLVVVG